MTKMQLVNDINAPWSVSRQAESPLLRDLVNDMNALWSVTWMQGLSVNHTQWSITWMQFGQWHKCRWISVNHTQWRGQKPSKINGSFDKWVFLIQLWYRELKRFSARKWQKLHNSPLSLSNSRLHENCVSQYYTRIAHFSLSFGGEMGQ